VTKEIPEKIIKPPVKKITSGKIFKPSRKYLRKLQVQMVFLSFIIWLFTILTFLLVSTTLPYSDPYSYLLINSWIVPVNLWIILPNLLWLIPALIVVPKYFRSIEYSVKAESGDTMPEIYSKRGIVTITRKHIPFRTITNISSRAGPLDRLFNIGSVHIETAGYSGSNKSGPEEKIAGVVFFEEVRDFILKELRKLRDPYVVGTEVNYPIDESVQRTQGLDDEILLTLREIRDLLRKTNK
jgi:membrane protein YdbS with pleckstrin-like domain